MTSAKEPQVSVEIAEEFGLTPDEYARVQKILGRLPSYTELGIFSVMWSEHCSYKSSRVHLKNLPTQGSRAPGTPGHVIQGPGENAGVVDIGDGMAVVFKMESHNHPSFIEPYQGAATGVGGILRDVFTMGARPIACLDALRFGRPEHPRTASLVEGVVAGIAGYGNAFGVPTVGGDVAFDACYDGNILVNAMAVGLARTDRIFYGKASGLGNPVLYIGAKTGRDGIHGATMASAEFGEDSEQKRPTVQVGDPFTEKLLLEACLELMSGGALVGIQDMGAAGLTSSSVEMASRAGSGIEMDLDAVPRRETGMTPYELMLSESQERMLLVAHAGREQEILDVCAKWDIDAAVVGRVTDSGRIVLRSGGAVFADIPIEPLTEALKLERPIAKPKDHEARTKLDLAKIAAPSGNAELAQALLDVLAAPQVASKAWVYRQYDHMVRVGTVVRPGSDAGVVRIVDHGAKDAGSAGGDKGIALTADCNGRFCFLDPYQGAQLTIAESFRNLCATGAEPIATTDCLNFGNPERPETMWQFAEAVRGLGDACRALDTPIVSGNVSLYNETVVVEDGPEGPVEVPRAIFPTPMIGMVGLLPHVADAVTQWFKAPGHEIAVIGGAFGQSIGDSAIDHGLGGSEYLKTIHGQVTGRPPHLDLARERAVGKAAVALARARIVASAHDCSEGGLAIALAESAVTGPERVGATVTLPADKGRRADAALFGEQPSRIVITYAPAHAERVAAICAEHGAPLERIGTTGGAHLSIGVGKASVVVPVEDLAKAFHGGFERGVFGR